MKIVMHSCQISPADFKPPAPPAAPVPAPEPARAPDPMARANLRWKSVMRYDRNARIFRIARVMWQRGKVGVPGGGYSAMLSFALSPRLFLVHREFYDLFVVVLGIRVHYQRAYGGIHT